MAGDESVRIAAVGDVHCGKTSHGAFQALFTSASQNADVLVLCGDLTDYGLPEEAEVLAKEITSYVRVPVVAVLGNHDFESGKQVEIHDILCEAGVHMLDGEACEVRGVGFAGVVGFGGGFGRYALSAWGEQTVKQFVHEAVNEALKLETALMRLRTEQKIAVLHYSPVRETVEGEPPEIFPFLGSSRLEDPLLHFPVAAVVHGHAHGGQPQGALRDKTPVYNVSMPLLSRAFPGRPAFRLLEFGTASSRDEEVAASAPS